MASATTRVPVYKSYGGVDADKPRMLTPSERQKIKEGFPQIRAGDKFTANLLREKILEKLDIEFQKYPICPSQIKEFTHRLYMHHLKSIIEPGTPAGIIAATSIGSKNTQSTLDSFHFSWKAASKSGLHTFDRLVNVSKTGTFSSTIYFRNKHLTAEEALMTRMWLEAITLDKLLLRKEIASFEQYYQKDYRWWYAFHPLTKGYRQAPVLRLYFDIDLLYRHQMSLQQIVTKFNDKLAAVDNYHQYFIGPNNSGIVDIYVATVPPTLDPESGALLSDPMLIRLREKMAALVRKGDKKPEEERLGNLSLTDFTAIEYYYTMVLYLAMEANILKGIPRIERIFVDTVAIPSVIKNSRNEDNRSIWQLDDAKMRRYGIGIEHLRILVKEAGMTLGEPYKSLAGSTLISVSEVDAKIKILTRIKEAQQMYDDELEQKLSDANDQGAEQKLNSEQLRKLINATVATVADRSRYPILQKSEYAFAQASGSNLARLLAHPLIDSTLTTCDNFHEINDVLGVVACKKEYLKKLQEVITGGLESNSHPVHIVLYANFVMSRGRPLGSTYSSVSRHPLGFLAEATIERAAAVFKTAAGFGATESANSVSTAVSLAKRINAGTGAFQIVYQVKNGDSYSLKYDENTYTAHKDDNDMIRRSAISRSEEESNEFLEGELMIPDIEDPQRTEALHKYEVVHPNAEVLQRKETGLVDSEKLTVRPLAGLADSSTLGSLLGTSEATLPGYLLPRANLVFGGPSAEALAFANLQKRELNAAKDLLENRQAAEMLAAYDPFVGLKLGIPHVTNAWLKYWEMLHLLKSSLEKFPVVNAFFNAELPGAGLMAFIRFCKQYKLRFTFRASSYLGENTLDDKFKLLETYKQEWLMVNNPLYDGDMTKASNLDYLETIEKCNFYSADASRGSMKDASGKTLYNLDEEYNAQLHLGTALAGFATLSPGGIFINKIFTYFEPLTWNLILLYSTLFDSFSIFKPETSRKANSEVYLIGVGFRPDENIYRWLKNILANFTMTPFLQNDLSTLSASLTIFEEQKEQLRQIAASIDRGDDIKAIKQAVAPIAEAWQKRYPLTFKGML